MQSGHKGANIGNTSGFLKGSQLSQLWVVDPFSRTHSLVHETQEHIEAPNWSPNGGSLIFNCEGRLYKKGLRRGEPPECIETDPELFANNDHIISPDGNTIYFSVKSGDVYAVPFSGGKARRVSNEDRGDAPQRCFVHGISPDGETLLYVGLRDQGGKRQYGIFSIPSYGGADTQILLPDFPVDGPEYAPDGQWIYFNGEDLSRIPGHAQIYRMRCDGTGRELLTDDPRVNWFPHVSPNGDWIVYISYAAGTVGHPANRDVLIRMLSADGLERKDVVAFLGGQGSLNVNSWSPDSTRFAYMAYPMIEAR